MNEQPTLSAAAGVSAIEGAPAEQVMDMLSEHVPLSLLMDLTVPEGPHSEEILDEEGEPETPWWEQPAT